MNTKQEVWSFFSGAMGLDIGLEKAGLITTLAVEVNPVFCRTIKRNMRELDVINADVRNLTGEILRQKRNFYDEVYMMVGGPPCQSFSTGGKRSALSDPRGNLVYEYFRLISEVQPKFFVFENVANILTAAVLHRKIEDRPGKSWNLKSYSDKNFVADKDGPLPLLPDEQSGSAFRFLLNDIKALGYNVNFGVVNSAEYGASQKRYRFIMIGSKVGSPPSLPEPTHGEYEHLPSYNTVRDAIGDITESPGPHSIYTDDMAKFFHLVPKGGNWRDLPEDIKPLALGNAFNSGGGKTGFFRKLSWDEPSPTIIGRANRKGSAMCHPEQIRPLSVKECARLQGFPDTWEIEGSMSDQYLQVGNAVPVHLGEAIGRLFVGQEGKYIQNFRDREIESLESMIEKGLTKLKASARNKKSRKAIKRKSEQIELF